MKREKQHNIKSLRLEYFARKQRVCEFKLYRDVMKDLLAEISKMIVDGWWFKMPYALGTMRIVKSPAKRKNINFGATNKLKAEGKNITAVHLNLDTEGNLFRWIWEKNKAMCGHIQAWKWNTLRKNKHAIKDNILKNYIPYFPK